MCLESRNYWPEGTHHCNCLCVYYRFRSSSIMKMTSILEEVENHPTFHGPLTRQRAEEMLKEQDKNCHLTRFSIERHTYILSVMNKKRWHKTALEHFDIEANKLNNTVFYRLKGYGEKKGSFSELLGYYQNARISRKISGIGSGIQCELKKSYSCIEMLYKRMMFQLYCRYKDGSH